MDLDIILTVSSVTFRSTIRPFDARKNLKELRDSGLTDVVGWGVSDDNLEFTIYLKNYKFEVPNRFPEPVSLLVGEEIFMSWIMRHYNESRKAESIELLKNDLKALLVPETSISYVAEGLVDKGYRQRNPQK